MDTGVVRRYLARLAEHGLAGKLHYLVGVAPLASARSARWMKEKLFGVVIPDWIVDRMEKASDPKAEGQAIAVEILNELKEIPGVSGAHLMAPLNESAIPAVIDKVRKG
jgi:methylenetetrahydrofolate reductase (NADPH)